MARLIVSCEIAGCAEPATHKIAARWTDGRFAELKTYGFACPDHVRDVCHGAEIRWLDYDPVKGEAVGPLAIYRYEEGAGDRHLKRDRAMEAAFLA